MRSQFPIPDLYGGDEVTQDTLQNIWHVNLNVHENHQIFVKIQISGLHPRVSDSGDSGWDSRICIFNNLSGATDAVRSSETPL